MAIEKAFAIEAQPARIFEAIERELREAGSHEGDTFEVLRRDPPHRIDLRVTMSGFPCWLTYRLQPRDGATEVAAILQPYGMRYTLFNIMTFGLRNQAFAIPLVEGLANLKADVEGTRAPDEFPDEAERLVSPPDE